jgi:hypothetical protein
MSQAVAQWLQSADTLKGYPMVEFLIFQNDQAEILRIVAYNARSLGCAMVYDTRQYHRDKWYCNKVENNNDYWTMRKFIMSLHENIAEKTYDDSMHHVGHVMPKFRVPHWDELIILEYHSISGALIRKDLLHVTGGRENTFFKRECLEQSFIKPPILFLTRIQSITPGTVEENVDVRQLLP